MTDPNLVDIDTVLGSYKLALHKPETDYLSKKI